MKDRNVNGQSVAFPIQTSLLRRSIIFIALVMTVLMIISYVFGSTMLINHYNTKLTDLLTYISHAIDADDLENCVATGVPSQRYAELQQFLNGLVDDMNLEYLYIVIPEETVMVNVVSATSAAERAAGEEDMSLLEETDAYSRDELKRFRSFWESEKVSFFKETSEYGTYYTGCLPVRNSSSQTVALICADLSMKTLEWAVLLIVLFETLSMSLVCVLAGYLVFRWIKKYVTNPVLALEQSARAYTENMLEHEDYLTLRFNAPEIHTGNEVESLSGAIERMASEIQKHTRETIEAEKRAEQAEQENARLLQEAETARKIDELSSSMSALLWNMPAMSFSKNVENGKYLACNQAFAEYANRKTPEEIVGLTDFDLFDAETAAHFVSDDRRANDSDEPYVYYEDVLDGAGRPCRFRTTKMRFMDETGRMCMLGMCLDVTELRKIQQENEAARAAYERARDASDTYSHIARALAADYSSLYYVALDTEQYIEYTSDVGVEELASEKYGENFFAKARQDSRQALYPEDQDTFIKLFTKENILEAIDRHGAFTHTYRLMTDGVPHYFNMKAMRMSDDPGHIIIGVNNVDAQMKYQEAVERIKEERITYARINALSGDYIAIYTVDPETDHYIEYSATEDYQGLGLATEGEAFFEASRRNAVGRIYSEDMDRFMAMMTRENILEEIQENGFFILNYRLVIDGEPVYVNMKAAMINEKDGPQMIVGVSNVDAQKKRELKYASDLSEARDQANIDSLTGVKNKHAYVDAEAKLNLQIEENIPVQFAITVCDLNGLKEINDTRGHQAGDLFIRKACGIICENFKHSPVFRVGGDEFAVIVQGADYERIDTLMQSIEERNLRNMADGDIVIATGMARYEGDRSVSAVFERADASMYANKHWLKSQQSF